MRLFAAAFAILIAAPAFAAPPAREMTGKRERGMRNCPSAVKGAVTTLDDRPDGVQLRVTARDPQAQEQIRARAHRQENITHQPARGAIEHTGQGTGSGEFGYCPGMEEGTMIRVQDLPNGVQLHVSARNPREVKSLQQTSRDRLDELRASAR